MCVLSTWFGDICCSRRTCTFYKRSQSLYFKFYSLRLLTPRPMQYRVPEKLHIEMHWQYWLSPLRGGNELRLLIYAVRVCRLPSLFSIMFLDTLYSKKWYDRVIRVFIRCSCPRFPALVDIRLVTISACALFFINYNNR